MSADVSPQSTGFAAGKWLAEDGVRVPTDIIGEVAAMGAVDLALAGCAAIGLRYDVADEARAKKCFA